ncbi:MAG: hypothetical protein R3A13_06005 [Bdellovibrionota bacterium]
MSALQNRRDDARQPTLKIYNTDIVQIGNKEISLELPAGENIDSRSALLLALLAITSDPFIQVHARTKAEHESYEKLKQREAEKRRRMINLINLKTERTPRFLRGAKRLFLKLTKTERFAEHEPVIYPDRGGWVNKGRFRYNSPCFSELEFRDKFAALKARGLILEYLDTGLDKVHLVKLGFEARVKDKNLSQRAA